MKVQCSKCQSTYKIDDNKIPDAGLKVKCSRCKNVFEVKKATQVPQFVAAKQSTLNVIFQVLGSNPTILQDKRARKIFYRMCDLAGMNPKELFDDETSDFGKAVGESMAQRGGSIAAPPAVASAPTTTPTEAVV